MAGKIFINYRRGDEPGFTQALLGRLEQTFSRDQLFIDAGYKCGLVSEVSHDGMLRNARRNAAAQLERSTAWSSSHAVILATASS